MLTSLQSNRCSLDRVNTGTGAVFSEVPKRIESARPATSPRNRHSFISTSHCCCLNLAGAKDI